MDLDLLSNRLQAGDAVEIELHAIEGMIYIPYERRAADLLPLKDPSGQTLKFSSLTQATAALSQTGLPAFDFVHTSSYGEMIGSPGSQDDTEMRQRITLAP